LGDDELRVPVIATGLDSAEARRTPPEPRRRTPDPTEEIERERSMVDAPNVTPIRDPEPAHVSAEALTEPPMEQPQVAAGGGQPAGQSAEDLAQSGVGFESPFEDELDTPAFLRKRSTSDENDRPPFMRGGGSS